MSIYRPIALANTFISKYGADKGIQHMKLQKLCYYSHGWWLAYKATPFLTERPQVWKYGPVFKSLYSSLANFGSQPITTPQKTNPFSSPEIIADTDTEIHQLIDWVWNRYSTYSSIDLSDMTHAEGTPWRQIAEQHDFKVPADYEIQDAIIKEYFSKEAAQL